MITCLRKIQRKWLREIFGLFRIAAFLNPARSELRFPTSRVPRSVVRSCVYRAHHYLPVKEGHLQNRVRPRRILIALRLRGGTGSVALLDQLEHFIFVGHLDLCQADDHNFLSIVFEYLELSLVIQQI